MLKVTINGIRTKGQSVQRELSVGVHSITALKQTQTF